MMDKSLIVIRIALSKISGETPMKSIIDTFPNAQTQPDKLDEHARVIFFSMWLVKGCILSSGRFCLMV